MSLSVPNMLGGGGGGFFPSVYIVGLEQTDTVSLTGNGKTYTPAWITKTDGTSGWLFDKIKELGMYTITAISTDETVKINEEIIIDAPIEYAISALPYKFTADDFNSAQKLYRTSTFTYTTLTNQVDGSDGISIKGKSSEGETYKSYLASLGRVVLVADLTYYKTLKFNVKKDADHGISRINILTTQPTTSTPMTDNLVFGKDYGGLSTGYVEYSIDISKYKGECYICLGGGYYDKTGYTSSKTSYCNVILE